MLASRYFDLGRLVVTRTINNMIEENVQFSKDVISAIRRYCCKDWGDLCEEDKLANNESLEHPDELYLLASYKTCMGKIWIITENQYEMGGNLTTILFPDER